MRNYSSTTTWLGGAELPASLSSQLLQQSVEVFKFGVFNDHFAAALAIFDQNFETECALQALLHFANVRIDGRFGLGRVLDGLFRMDQALDVILCLANRKRKRGDTLSSLLHFFAVLEG